MSKRWSWAAVAVLIALLLGGAYVIVVKNQPSTGPGETPAAFLP